MTNTIVCSLDTVPLNSAVLSTLKKNYPLIEYTTTDKTVTFKTELLSHTQRSCIESDLIFFQSNPHLPLENLCSQLSNYTPQNDSQKIMLEYAYKLVELDEDSSGAGLFMFGDAGIGKSHIAIGISKLFMQRGLNPQFLVAEKYTFSTRIELHPEQVWVIDDMNSGFHVSSRLFKQVVLNAHERGGRVFVTSNKEYDELMSELFVGDSKANKIRYVDRTKGMFKILHVTGSSHRQAHAWYK